MFWILRRTGAASFFNSLNNNCAGKANNNNNNDKNVKRPPRKAYGRLSMDSDDASSIQKHIDDPFDDNLNNYEMIERENGNLHTEKDIQGNYEDDNSDLELDGPSKNTLKQHKELNENTISRLQAIAMSDDEDYDESLTCNVCDRAFHCHRQLASHQQKKRHFGCSGCDSLFPSLMLLEHHKEEFEHWSDDEDNRRPCCRRNRTGGYGGDGDDFTDTDSITSEAESEDLERLL